MNLKRHPLLLLALLCFSVNSQNTHPQVLIQSNKVISNEFIGIGFEFSAYPHADAENAEWGKLMTDEKWEEVFERVSFIKPKIVRVIDQANWRYLKGFDNKGNPLIDFESEQMQALYKLLDYCQENKIIVILGEWGQPYKVHDTHLNLQNSFTGANDPKWINLIIKNLKHLILDKKYTCIKYYNLVNEPNGYWATTDGDWDQWKQGASMLNLAIKNAGLATNVALIGPDSTPYDNPKSKYKGLDWARQAVLQIPDLISAYDVHDYPSKESIRVGEFQKTYTNLIKYADSLERKPFILGELGITGPSSSKKNIGDKYSSKDSQLSVYDYDYGVDMADALIQSLNSGFDAVIAWDLDDAMHTLDDKGDKFQLKRWGMFNILGEELTGKKEDSDLRPWFYTWSIICRYFEKDMKIVKIENLNIEKVRAAAGISPSGDITIAIVNNSNKDANFNLNIKDFQKEKIVKKYLFSENNRIVNEKGFPIPQKDKTTISNQKSIKVAIPAKSVILYTSYN
ncbi:cellulase family glycosylhydrolase [Flavobacterium sp. RSP15]|uniref:cellulase family glycosylhydrolase n=1 Tax=Flavobacterium sp. RSP15 TaxID=2497485 RepID=UPI000F82BF96|nr:cellulase family glycosylhydrolase [Flavobacterium sp. RSP15]RTY86234.1 hypothetical protein EKM00_10945 [Flavobacterium sp. RSP15]